MFAAVRADHSENKRSFGPYTEPWPNNGPDLEPDYGPMSYRNWFAEPHWFANRFGPVFLPDLVHTKLGKADKELSCYPALHSSGS